MPNFIIKTHRKETVYKANRIFILSKGMNAGKPQYQPFTNSFVILFQNQEDAETFFWLAYSLWRAKFWHQSLIGSVIPFLRISDFKKDFISKVNETLEEHELHKKHIQALRILQKKEDQLMKSIVLINEMKRLILLRYGR